MTPVLKHSRITMNGIAANWVSGSWLFKGEAAHIADLHYSGVTAEYARADILLGVEYSGITNSSLSLEIVERQITNHDSALQMTGVDKSARQLALAVKRDLNHDRLHLMALLLLNDWKTGDGGIARLSGEYELSDNLAVTVGVVDYLDAAALPYSGVEDNDRLFGRLEYSF